MYPPNTCLTTPHFISEGISQAAPQAPLPRAQRATGKGPIWHGKDTGRDPQPLLPMVLMSLDDRVCTTPSALLVPRERRASAPQLLQALPGKPL